MFGGGSFLTEHRYLRQGVSGRRALRIPHEIAGTTSEPAREAKHVRARRIPLAPLYQSDVVRVEVGPLAQRLLRQPKREAPGADGRGREDEDIFICVKKQSGNMSNALSLISIIWAFDSTFERMQISRSRWLSTGLCKQAFK